MSTNEEPGIARQLIALQDEIIALMNATESAPKRKRLAALRRTLGAESERLIAADLDASTAAYREVADGIKRASEATRVAITKVNSIQSAINSIARVVDLAAKIVA